MDEIEFICDERWRDIIPEPEPAHKVLPLWYKKLPLEQDGGGERTYLSNSTVKACIPFLEAMKTGWIFKTPCDVYIKIEDGDYESEWRMNEKAMSHFKDEAVGPAFPGGKVVKFNNLWRVNAPDGYSMLFTHPFNRLTEDRFHTFSGIIAVDEFDGCINHPVNWTAGDWEGVIPKGTPVAQGIPFKRDAIPTDAVVRTSTDEEDADLQKHRDSKDTNQRHYRENQWTPLDASSNHEG